MKAVAANLLLLLSVVSHCNGGFLPAQYQNQYATGAHLQSDRGQPSTSLFFSKPVPVDDTKPLTSKEDDDDKKKKDVKKKDKDEYKQRRQQWLERYGSLEALQSTFGTGGNNNKLGFFRGDLSPEQTRRLYHTLLPRSLLGLYELKLMKPEELAPLAYNARIAAKHYARSRCVWYARVGTAIFDQYRNIRDRGQLRFGDKSSSMTWEEIWDKYEAQIVQEECADELDLEDDDDDNDDNDEDNDGKKKKRFKEKDLTMRIYLRILEKSCATNQAFDKLFLKNNSDNNNNNQPDPLAEMGEILDKDVRELLLPPKESAKVEKKMAKIEEKQLKEEEKQREEEEEQLKEQIKEEYKRDKEALKEQKRQLKAEKKRKEEEAKIRKEEAKAKEKEAKKLGSQTAEHIDEKVVQQMDEEHVEPTTTLSPQQQLKRWRVLRVMAGTRQKFRSYKQKK